MRTDVARPVRLADYRPADYLIDTVHLDISLTPRRAAIVSTLVMRPNPAGLASAELVLDGDALTFVQATLDGVPLLPGAITVTPEAFVLHRPPQRPFTLVIETLLDPTANTQLMGLYRTSTCYCTQCEAEGFRRITYFLDRPDVLSVYTLRIEADRTEAPVLLGNGNRIETGELANGRHFAIWHDPFPKPSYLFAMVAGDLGHVADRFTTRSGRDVALEIYVEHGKEGRCAYAMDALKRSMRWDEEAFGREYDLDIFMIVAVSDFNMGAMENKGLNIFNDRYVLATPETATDQDYANIEAIIAHEYFHNWTGNRITCRDWFQLCLKEGLTVFRDQEFSSDQRSRAVKRINDVRLLRNQQFSEDSGPLAHPVRPEIYHEINNFYTATVYEKGAEIVRMLKAYIGDDAFRAGMDLYFERHDGEATTIEVFLACFAQASGRDLGQFFLWYRQSGTPRLTASGEYDARAKSYMLDLRQTLGPTPGQPTKLPMVIPVRMGLVSAKGDLKPTAVNGAAFEGMLTLTKEAESFTFEGVEEAPVPSLLRGFSAPVTLNLEQSEDDLVILFQNDPDPFNRWQAAQSFATKVILRKMQVGEGPLDPRFVSAVRTILAGAAADPAFAALLLTLPSETDLAREVARDVDPDAIYAARLAVRRDLSRALATELRETLDRLAQDARYSPDAASAGRRAIANAVLDLACASGDAAMIARVHARYQAADNMTDRMASLLILCQHAGTAREAALADFEKRYADDPLIIDKWMSAQAQIAEPETLDRVRRLMGHPSFSMANPNRVRSLIGAFAQGNATQFNRQDGEGYRFLASIVIEIDPANPQLAARLLGAFKSWRAIESIRRAQAEASLMHIADQPGLSRDVIDIVKRALA